MKTIFTIGHSIHSQEAFIELLLKSGVNAIADVRSTPFSRYQDQFNKTCLPQALQKKGISYAFLGKELGARSLDESCYKNGQISYRKLAATKLFKSGLKRVISGSESYSIALMCAEKEPLVCHRTLMVAHELDILNIPIKHIHADGNIESHRNEMLRLLGLTGLSLQLFKSEDELIAEACSIQERRTAYRKDRNAR